MKCNKSFHHQGLVNHLRKDHHKKFKNKKLSIYFLQVFNPENVFSKIYDDFYIKSLPILKEFYSSMFDFVEFKYKARSKNDIPKNISNNEHIITIYDKDSIYGEDSARVVITGETSLAFEMKEAGFFVIGLALKEEEIETFPSYIYSKTLSTNNINEIKKNNSGNFLPTKKEIDLVNDKKVLTCFNKNEPCISWSELNEKIMKKKINSNY